MAISCNTFYCDISFGQVALCTSYSDDGNDVSWD
jgi:hypothetical protein